MKGQMVRVLGRLPGRRWRGCGGQRVQTGSILIFVLFVCLAVAVGVQTVSTVVLCAERAGQDESAGRARMAEKDDALAELSRQTLHGRQATPWTVIATEPHVVEGRVEKPSGSGGSAADNWVLKATARHEPGVSRLMTSAWLERGRDGLDLPVAGLVADSVLSVAGRESPWLDGDNPTVPDQPTIGYLATLPIAPLVGDGWSLSRMNVPWRLDPGWVNLATTFAEATRSGSGSGSSLGGQAGPGGATGGGGAVAPAAGVVVIAGGFGHTASLPVDLGGRDAAAPCLVLVTGGANLNARGRGDLYGVIVVDDGGVLLDGTTLHGALFATGGVNMGGAGRVLYSRGILRWATDRSLERVRLVPGSREESVE